MAAEVLSTNMFEVLAEEGEEETPVVEEPVAVPPVKKTFERAGARNSRKASNEGKPSNNEARRPPKRDHDRHSAGKPGASDRTEHRQGAGKFNWGQNGDQVEEAGENKEVMSPPAGETPVEEEVQQMSLDEYLAARAPPPSIQHNIRVAGEGVDDKKWSNAAPITRDYEKEDIDVFFDGTASKSKKGGKQRKERKEVLMAAMAPSWEGQYEPRRESRGRGGRGRGGFRGAPRGGPRGGQRGGRGRGGPGGPRGGQRGGGRGGQRSGFDAADQNAFPSLGSQ